MSDDVVELVRALDDPDPDVRLRSVRLLDHEVLDAEIFDRLAQVATTAHGETLRKWTLHTLTCDFCKSNRCDPDLGGRTTDVLLDRLENDRSRHVRRFAASCLVQPSRRDDPRVRTALLTAERSDPSNHVRSMLTPMLLRWGWTHREAPPAG